MSVKLSIVIPCYNEAENIPLMLERFKKVLAANQNISVILVNNGSTDNSQEILDSIITRYSFARTVLVPKNKGYGYGILQGLKDADGDYIGWTHADMQTDPNDVVRAYSVLLSRSRDDIFLKGRRHGRPIFDRIFTAGMGIFETLYFGTVMYDINAQPNIFPRKFFLEWNNPPYDFALDLYAFYQAKRHKLEVIRFPVDFSPRQHGASKWNTGLLSKLKFIKRTVKFSVELKRMSISS